MYSKVAGVRHLDELHVEEDNDLGALAIGRGGTHSLGGPSTAVMAEGGKV